MKYQDSKIDKKLREKFKYDFDHANLTNIQLRAGNFRGLSPIKISFNYPISAISGKNGSGKSTILALACCAYHNKKTGFKLPKRKTPYYTFSDFFVQHQEETPPQGIEIYYGFAHNAWRTTEDQPEKKRVGFQRRWKSKGGKWNNYANRINRNVVFLGIERIVPHSERSQSRSYSKTFKNAEPKGWEDKVKSCVGYILGKKYDKFRYLEHSKYSLPMVQIGETIYSGFNMGAGENALFEIFSTIYSCGEGSLLVIDEIELGLHVEAQKKFISKLKDVCLETHTQIICTTHSKEIFECLPLDARFFIENINYQTKLTNAIASDFAFSKLSAITGQEMDILVEDDVAEMLISASLPSAIRSRVSITKIGSASALSKQLAASYIRGESKPTLAIFDGDQREKEKDNLDHAKRMAETTNSDFETWIKSRIAYLPTNQWPEAWLLQKGIECLEDLSRLTNSDAENFLHTLQEGKEAGKHKEFYEISKNLGLEREHCLHLFTSRIVQSFPEEVAYLVDTIAEFLDQR